LNPFPFLVQDSLCIVPSSIKNQAQRSWPPPYDEFQASLLAGTLAARLECSDENPAQQDVASLVVEPVQDHEFLLWKSTHSSTNYHLSLIASHIPSRKAPDLPQPEPETNAAEN
jgi:hypothetical protein